MEAEEDNSGDEQPVDDTKGAGSTVPQNTYDDHTYANRKTGWRKGLPICVICRSKCANKVEWRKHIDKYHKRSSTNSCPHCYENCKTKKSLNNHINKKHYDKKGNTKKNNCVVCGLKFDTERQYKKHVSDVHNKTKAELLTDRTTNVGKKEVKKEPESKEEPKMKPNKSKVNGASDQNTNHKDNSINDVKEEEMKSKGKGTKHKDCDFMKVHKTRR